MASDVKSGADHAREATPEDVLAPDIAVKRGAERVALAQMLTDEAPKGYDFLILGISPAQCA